MALSFTDIRCPEVGMQCILTRFPAELDKFKGIHVQLRKSICRQGTWVLLFKYKIKEVTSEGLTVAHKDTEEFIT